MVTVIHHCSLHFTFCVNRRTPQGGIKLKNLWIETYKLMYVPEFHPGSLFTTEAVLTEVLYLLNFSVKAQEAAINFILNLVVELIPSSADSLKKAITLMKKYSDLPMDYADATIVCLAMETGIHNIITLDKKDFGIYRLKRKPFCVFP